MRSNNMITLSNGKLTFKDNDELNFYMELGSQILNRNKNFEEKYIEVSLPTILEKDVRDKFSKYMLRNGWDYICHSITETETIFIICNTNSELKEWMNETENTNAWTVCINPRISN